MGTLYIVPTPIGNLEDITLRALRVLREAALVAAEDTRTTRVLLDHYGIGARLISYHEHNKLARLDAIFDALAAGDVALVSDAGTPGVSDPGYELIVEAIRRGVRVEPLPGANAILTALVGSGLPTDSFVYLGFLPRRTQALRALLADLAGERRTLVAYESPRRLVETLALLLEAWGDRPACVARELTKLHEEFRRGPVSALLAHYRDQPLRGEITLVVGGASTTAIARWDEARLRAALAERLRTGEPLSRAARALAAESGWDRRAIYALGAGHENDPGNRA